MPTIILTNGSGSVLDMNVIIWARNTKSSGCLSPTFNLSTPRKSRKTRCLPGSGHHRQPSATVSWFTNSLFFQASPDIAAEII